MSHKELTQKQKLYVTNILNGMKKRDAARQAGYNTKNENSLDAVIRKIESSKAVQERLLIRQKERDERLAIEEDYELKRAHEEYEEGRANGDPLRYKYLDMMAKMRGKYVLKHEVNVKTAIAEYIGGISEE